MSRSFWMQTLDSLPPSVRERYAPHFHQAEIWEQRLDAALVLWRRLRLGTSLALFRAACVLHPDVR
jgi:hypothetical protein